MRLRLAALVFVFVCLIIVPLQSVLAATGNEYIWTDEPQYLKGDTAQIYGTGFAPYTSILIKVTRPDSSVVTGDGTETPGSDTVVTNVDGNFAYSYFIDGILAEGTYTIEAIDTAPEPDQILATATFIDTAQFLLQGCSWHKGDCTQESLPAWANGATPMDGWTSGVLKGWFELEDVPYRIRINLPKPGDAGNYYITNEHDNLSSGVTGVDDNSEFYVGKLIDGTLTKTCTFSDTNVLGAVGIYAPTSPDPCNVTAPTYTGTDDDGDTFSDEEPTDGIDDDSDTLIDEDPFGSSTPAQKIQSTWAVLFESSEAGGNDKKWALYWKAHLALGSSGFPGASLHGNTTATGMQDVPILNVQPSPPAPADLFVNKTYTGTVNPGKTLSFTLNYGNTGGGDASNVVITDDYDEDYIIPSNICCGGSDNGDKITWNIGTVFFASGPFQLTYDGQIHDGTPDTIAHMPIGDTHVVNTATITTSSVDSDPSDNIASADILVHAEPNLFVTKTVNSSSQATVVAGDTVTIILTYGNSDNNDAPNVTLCDDYNQAYLMPTSISDGGVDNGDKICWGSVSEPNPGFLPGVLSGTRTLPGIDPAVGYQATVIDDTIDWSDPATITTSDPEPAIKLANNTAAVQYKIPKPTAVRISSFNAIHTGEYVVVSWNTGSEIDSEGFYLMRGSSPEGPFTRITPSMIESKGNVIRGMSYSFVDSQAKEICPDKCYYKLEEIDTRGKTTQFGPVTASLQVQSQDNMGSLENETPMSLRLANDDENNSPLPTYTSTVTAYSPVISVSGEVAYAYYDDREDVAAGFSLRSEIARSADRHGRPEEADDVGQTFRSAIPEGSADLYARHNQEAELLSGQSPESIRFTLIDAEGNEAEISSLTEGRDRPSGLSNQQGLVSFRSKWDGGMVILTWYAKTPVKGFHILRSINKEGPYSRITRTPIPYIGYGSKTQLFQYTFIDTKVDKSNTYFYRLEVIEQEEIAHNLH